MSVSHVYADNGDATVKREPGVSVVHVDNMPQGGGGGGGAVDSVNGKTGTVVLTASDVGALPSSTSIPTKTSDLTNDSGFITSSDIPPQQQADWDESDASDPSYIQNKPTIPAAQVNSDWNAASGVAQILNKPSLATVATSGDYDDLQNKPTIPAAQVNSDWNSSSGVSEILNKPNLATVATSGSYNDLSNKPTINNVPAVTSSDDGKILTASYSGGVGSYAWATAGGGSESVKVLEINTDPCADSTSINTIRTFLDTYAEDYPVIIYQINNKGQSNESIKYWTVEQYYHLFNTQGVSGNYSQFILRGGVDDAYNTPYYMVYPYDDGEGNIDYTYVYYQNSIDYSGSTGYNYGSASFSAVDVESNILNSTITDKAKSISIYVESSSLSSADKALLVNSGDQAFFELRHCQLIRDEGTMTAKVVKFYDVFDGVAAGSKYLITATFNYPNDPYSLDSKTLTVEEFASGGGSSTPSVEVVPLSTINTRFASYDAMTTELSSGTKAFVFVSTSGAEFYSVATFNSSRVRLMSFGDYQNSTLAGTPCMYINYIELRKVIADGSISAQSATQVYDAIFNPGQWVGTYLTSGNIPQGDHYTNEIVLASRQDGSSVYLYRCKGDYTESTSNTKVYNDSTNWERIFLDSYLTKLRTSVRNAVPVPSNGTLDILVEWENNVIVLDTTDSDPLVITNASSVPNLVLQWTVNSSTTLPTMPSGYHAATSNPTALVVGNTYQLSILNNCYSIVEFA